MLIPLITSQAAMLLQLLFWYWETGLKFSSQHKHTKALKASFIHCNIICFKYLCVCCLSNHQIYITNTSNWCRWHAWQLAAHCYHCYQATSKWSMSSSVFLLTAWISNQGWARLCVFIYDLYFLMTVDINARHGHKIWV